MRSEEAVVGKQVQVEGGHRRREFRGAFGTILKRYGDPDYVAVEVEFANGRCELFWHHELGEVEDNTNGQPGKALSDTPKRVRAAKSYWLIVKRGSFRINVHTLPDEAALPVFSHEVEATSFLGVRGLEGGWRARETSVGELASMLLGPYAHVSRVTLDPPSGAAAGLLAGLVSVDRTDFVDLLMQNSPPDVAEKITGR